MVNCYSVQQCTIMYSSLLFAIAIYWPLPPKSHNRPGTHVCEGALQAHNGATRNFSGGMDRTPQQASVHPGFRRFGQRQHWEVLQSKREYCCNHLNQCVHSRLLCCNSKLLCTHSTSGVVASTQTPFGYMDELGKKRLHCGTGFGDRYRVPKVTCIATFCV